MLFAISGSQSTGKSTVLSALRAEYDNLQFVERKTSRSILSDWGVSLQEVNSDVELCMKFQDEILKRKMIDDLTVHGTEATTTVTFTERTPIDLAVYAIMAIGNNNNVSDWVADYCNRCIEATKIYSAVVLLTSGHFDVVADGTRSTNEYYSFAVNALMHQFYNTYTSNHTIVTTIDLCDIHARIGIIRTIINKMISGD